MGFGLVHAASSFESDSSALMTHVDNGDWDMEKVCGELKSRWEAKAKEQGKEKQATIERYITIVGDPEGRIAKARLTKLFTSIRRAVHTKLILLDVAAVADAVGARDAELNGNFIRQTRGWLDDFERQLNQGIQIVHRQEGT